METEGALSWEMGELPPGGEFRLPLFLAFGDGVDAALVCLNQAREQGVDRMRERTLAYWREYLSRAKPVQTGEEEIDRLYRRSLIVFKLMSDERYGSLIAAQV